MKISACRKSYRGKTVLQCPEMEYQPGRIYAVVGPNGSGKSTYARLAAGVIKKDGGGMAVVSHEKPICHAGGSQCQNSEWRKNTRIKEILYMPQKSFPFRMSLEKNILLAGNDRQRAAKLMESLRLSSLSGRRARELSGGETAKMALARVLMKPCAMLILDEPTSAMDMESAIAAEQLIHEYTMETGCCVLFVTHDLSQARRMATDALFFFHGELCEFGPSEKVLYDPARPETRTFLEYYGGLGQK